MRRLRNRSTRVAAILAELSDFELAKDGFATLVEAADFLTIGETKIRELIAEGELVAGYIGRARVVAVRSLYVYAASILVRADRRAA